MSLSWYRTGKAAVTQNSNIVRFTAANITTAPNKPVVGDAFLINNGTKLYEIIAIDSDTTGEYIRLDKIYAESTATNSDYAIIRFASGTQNAKLVAMASAAINQKQISLDDMYEWYTTTADTVDFLGVDGVPVTVKSYFKLASETGDVANNSGAVTTVSTNIEAVKTVSTEILSVKSVSDNMAEVKLLNRNAVGMSQAQFEANRRQNRQFIAASGFVHFGKNENQSAWVSIVNQGMNTYSGIAAYANAIGLGRGTEANPVILSGKSSSRLPVVHIAGCIFTLECLATASKGFEAALVKFPQAPDGKTTYNKSTGANTVHATVTAAFNAQAADPSNVEVVTDRVDMWGFEAWLEEVNITNPYVYPNGLIQSQDTTMEGIATSASARPVTYYAVFDGDTGSKGKGLNFFALTDVQKKKVLGNHKNNLYYLDDGRLVQWRLRQRTIVGAGNGDWLSVESQKNDSWNSLGFAGIAQATAQGAADTVQSFSNAADGLLIGTLALGWNKFDHLKRTGAFLAVGQDNQYLFPNAVNGECYFLVCGTVNRLNQGAYHPSFNPSGASNVMNSGGGGNTWNASNQASLVTSTHACFELAIYGVISSTISGRPDGRLYDAIYADGAGGVCRDMRYSAYGVDSVDFAEADQKVKNGTYRGFEKPLFTRFYQNAFSGYFAVENNYNAVIKTGASGSGVLVPMYSSGLAFKDPIIMWNSVTNQMLYGAVSNADGYVIVGPFPRNLGQVSHQSNLFRNSTDLWYFAKVTEQPSSVGGSFLQTDVIGNPVNILATPALANGWQGSWIPVIPDGTPKQSPLTRKSLSSLSSGSIYSDNNGSYWQVWGGTIDMVKNLFPISASADPAGRIAIIPYQAFAKQTENAVNAEVYGGFDGLHDVTEYGGYFAPVWGATFFGSLIGELCVSDAAGGGASNLSLTRKLIRPDTFVMNPVSDSTCYHHAISKPAPTNGSSGGKALGYNVKINQQANIQYAYTQLRHNGTNWGDDGKVIIVDNQSTKTDLNGNTVLVGTAKLKEPIGWIKIKV